MRKLWLHIGSHKTGTTTMQKALRAASKKKRLGGWTYISQGNSINLNDTIAIRGEGAETRWRTKAKLLSSYIPPAGNCIISAERYFWLDEEVEIAQMHKVLTSSFDEIKVVAYLRRQDFLALSFRKTAISTVVGRQFFGMGLDALPEYQAHMDRYFDYAKKISQWEEVFGEENVIVRRYAGGDTVTDFSQVTGIEIPVAGSMVNKSWSRKQLLSALWLQSKGYKYSEFAEIIEALQGTERLLPSRSQAGDFLGRFQASNAILAQKYDPDGDPSYFGMDLSMYPEASNNDVSDLLPFLSEIEEGLRRPE